MPTASKRPALNFIVSVKGDYFPRPEKSRPIQARELGFPDQPLARWAGSKRKIEERASSTPLYTLYPLSLFPFLQHFAFSRLISFFMLFFSFLILLTVFPPMFPLKRK